MALEYFVAFTDVKNNGEDVTEDVIETAINELKLSKLNAAKYNFLREEIPFIGEMNVFRSDWKRAATIVHTSLERYKKQGLDMCVFPVVKDKK